MNKNSAGNHATAATEGGTFGAHAETAIDPLITDKEGADLLRCSRATFWRRTADGIIPKPIKIGGTSRWRQSWILETIAKAEAESRAA